MERMPECLLNRRHCRGSKSFSYGRHSGILSTLLAWASKSHACCRMPAQPAGMPAGMPEACLQAAGMLAGMPAAGMPAGMAAGMTAAGMPTGMPAGIPAGRRHATGIPCRHPALLLLRSAHLAGMPRASRGPARSPAQGAPERCLSWVGSDAKRSRSVRHGLKKPRGAAAVSVMGRQ